MTDRTFMGMPVSGDIHEAHREDQRSISELQPVFEALVNHPKVVDFGWTQYTPYFNDGDTCEFGVSDPWLRTVDDVIEGEEDDFDHYDFEAWGHPTLGGRVWDFESKEIRLVENKYPDVSELLSRLAEITWGCYENDLLNTFGDHAKVTVTKNGIKVDAYSHD